MPKKLVLGPILVKIWATNSFFKNLASLFTNYYGKLLSCKISEKTNNPILRKLSDGQMDRWMDKSDFTGHRLTKIELPTILGSGHWKRSQ